MFELHCGIPNACLLDITMYKMHVAFILMILPEYFSSKILTGTYHVWGTAVAQWLRYCATNRKVAGSIPAGVSGFFIEIKSFRSHYGSGVDSASNRNEYQEHFPGLKTVGA